MATPVGSRGIAAHNALSSEPPYRVDHRVIPRTIFIDPQIGIVGLTEEQAVQAGHPYWCNTLPMSPVPRAGAIRDTRGLIKMVADDQTEAVPGVSMGRFKSGRSHSRGGDGAALSYKIRDFVDLLHVYPTMAEALKIAAIFEI